MLPEDGRDSRRGRRFLEQHDDPNAIVVKPGETKELTWRFTRAGKLEFDCNVPGHYEADMAGTISLLSPQRHRAAPGTP